MGRKQVQPVERPADGRYGGDEPLLRVGVSSCLLGEEVRFDGGHKRDPFLVRTLGQWVEWVPLCPEVEIGLGTPRESLRLVGDVEAPRMVAPRSGADHTGAMVDWSRAQATRLRRASLDGYVLKAGSPSCGLFRVRVYPGDGGGAPDRSGRGLFAAELTRVLPLLPVEEEGRLHDPGLRENFVERLFAYRRWRGLLAEDPSPGGLVAFHTAHKLTVLAHDPEAYRRLGRLVAEAGARPWEELADEYGRGLFAALEVRATRGRHANVLQHLMGFLKDRLDAADKAELLDLVERYRTGMLPLVVPLTLLGHHLRRHDVPEWVDRQVYLHPYPRELMLRNHV